MLKVTTSNREIENLICGAIASEINSRTTNRRLSIETKVRSLVRANLLNSEVAKELSSDTSDFRKQLGIQVDAIGKVIEEFVSSIVVWRNDIAARQSSGLSTQPIITIVSEKVNEISKQVSAIVTAKGVELDWLQWLLERGDNIIVVNFAYRPANSYEIAHSISRAGGLMYSGGVKQWGVDPQYSGIDSDNFITRALVNLQDDIEKIIIDEIG